MGGLNEKVQEGGPNEKVLERGEKREGTRKVDTEGVLEMGAKQDGARKGDQTGCPPSMFHSFQVPSFEMVAHLKTHTIADVNGLCGLMGQKAVK